MALIRKIIHNYFPGRGHYIVWFFSLFLIPVAIFRIKNLKEYNIGELINFASNMCFGLIEPAQSNYEISKLLEILYKFKPKVILEIGTLEGGTLFLFSRIAPKDALIISLDFPPAKILFKLRKPLYKAFASNNQQLYLIKKDSHNKEALENINEILKNRKIDFLFIDGDHTYEGVKKDFEMYAPLVSKNGLIAFHDIVLPKPDGEVNAFWNEIKSQYKHEEFIDRKNKIGIGLIKL